MARKIKFALEMANGKKVNTLEELQEHGDIATVLQYFYNKRLMKWLDDHDAADASRALAELDEHDENLAEQIAEILGLNVESVAVDMVAIREKEEKERQIKEAISNQAVIEEVDSIYASQTDRDVESSKGNQFVDQSNRSSADLEYSGTGFGFNLNIKAERLKAIIQERFSNSSFYINDENIEEQSVTVLEYTDNQTLDINSTKLHRSSKILKSVIEKHYEGLVINLGKKSDNLKRIVEEKYGVL